MRPGMKGFYVDIAAELHKRLKAHCVEEGKSLTWVIAKLIKEYLDKTTK